jgi:hypothetical protein
MAEEIGGYYIKSSYAPQDSSQQKDMDIEDSEWEAYKCEDSVSDGGTMDVFLPMA